MGVQDWLQAYKTGHICTTLATDVQDSSQVHRIECRCTGRITHAKGWYYQHRMPVTHTQTDMIAVSLTTDTHILCQVAMMRDH